MGVLVTQQMYSPRVESDLSPKRTNPVDRMEGDVAVISVNDSIMAWAAIMRSNGSRCCQSSVPASSACADVIFRSWMPSRSRCAPYARSITSA